MDMHPKLHYINRHSQDMCHNILHGLDYKDRKYPESVNQIHNSWHINIDHGQIRCGLIYLPHHQRSIVKSY